MNETNRVEAVIVDLFKLPPWIARHSIVEDARLVALHEAFPASQVTEEGDHRLCALGAPALLQEE